MTVAIASSMPSGGYLYFFSSFLTMDGRDIPAALVFALTTIAAWLRYEDTIIQQQRSDAGSYLFWVPGGGMGICRTTPRLISAARELKHKILDYAVRSASATSKVAPGSSQISFSRSIL